ncbi:MAG: histidinol-phosphatase HisJ family protein [Clostridia bacterium]|jgi:histidinol-phosphatase (PHP family)|nr:histidinol-phosphatase HisJ family protein [Clostridia bacterium]MCI9291506.1 histidinol-phosphatase HisJ family protein [Clostridia bacterium]
MFDTHTHCLHSHDSKEDPRDMILAAIDKGLDYIAFTDHYDGELTLLDEFSYIPQIDLDRHFKEISQLKDEFKGKIQVGVGIECGYMKEADDVYLNTLAKYDIDVTINSVHMVEYEDCYLPSFFQKRTKAEAYGAYLKAIRESVDSPYEFDSIGHIGYVVRKSIYDDKSLRYDEFSDIIDDILQSIIAKGKALEVNSRGGDLDFLPTVEILKRYKELGGELLTFGSDAHLKSRIGEKYKLIADVLKGLGYKYLFKYLSHKPIAVKL